jgi:hypothetical protein
MLVVGGTDRVPTYEKEHDVNFVDHLRRSVTYAELDRGAPRSCFSLIARN